MLAVINRLNNPSDLITLDNRKSPGGYNFFIFSKQKPKELLISLEVYEMKLFSSPLIEPEQDNQK